MANFFSLQDGNLPDHSIYGYSLTGAEIMNNTTGTMLLTSSLYSSNYSSDGSTLSAVSLHLSARAASPTGTLGLTLQRIASAGVFVDSSSNNLTVTTVGSAYQNTFTPFSPNGWSGYFNGTTDYITTQTNSVLNLSGVAYTIEFWINPSTIAAGQRGIINLYVDGSGTTTGLNFYQDAANIRFNNGVVVGTGTVTSNNPLSAGIWTHVALISQNVNSHILYVNGVSAANYNNPLITASTNKAILGNWSTLGVAGYFNGYISNVRIIKGTALYTSNFTPSASPLTLLTNTSLLTLQDNRFKDNSTNNLTLTANGSVAIKDTSPFTPVAFDPAVRGGSVFLGGIPYLTVPNQISTQNFIFGTGDFTIEAWIYPTITQTGPIIAANNVGTATGWSLYLQGTKLGWEKYGYGTNASDSFATSLTSNSWSHVVISRKLSSLSAFANGVFVGSITDSQNYNSIPYNPSIGADQDGTNPFNGYISNVRVVKGTAVYTTNFTPPTAQLTNISGTSLLLNTNNYGLKSSATETYAISSFTSYDGSNNILTPYPQNWQILKLTNPLSTNRNDVINYTLSTSSPNQLSLMAGAVTATDTTGLNRLSTVGSPTLTSFKPYTNFDDSYFLNGTTDWFVAPANTNFNFSGDFTIEMWVNTSTYTPDTSFRRIFTFGPDAANNLELMFYTTVAASSVSVYANTANIITGTISVADGNWHHVAVSRYNNAVRLYVDGVQSGSTKIDTTVFNAGVTNGLSIGTYNNTAAGRLSAAYLNNFRIVNGTAVYTTSAFTPPTTPLTNIPNTVFLMKNSVRYDQALITANSVLTGYASTNTAIISSLIPSNPRDSYTYFDGASYVEPSISSALLNPGSSDFTMEAWIHPLASAGSILHINKDTTGGTVEIRFYITGNQLGTIFYGNQNATNYKFSTTGGTLTLSAWNHVAWTRTGNVSEAYINGTRVISGAMTEGAVNTEICFARIGKGITSTGTGDSFSYFNGYISNVRLIKGVSLYTGATITMPTASLSAVAGTNLLALQGTQFVDSSINKFTLNKTGTPSIFPSYIPNVTTAISFNASQAIGISNISNLNFAQMFNLEWWVYLYPDSSYEQILFVKHGGGATGIEIGVDRSDLFYIQFGASKTTVNTKVPRNQWNHLAINRDSTGFIRMFINGILDKTFTSTHDPTVTNSAYIGTGYTGSGTCIYLLAGIVGSKDVYPIYTNNFIPNNSLKLSLGNSIYLNASTYSNLSSYIYTQLLGDINIGGSLKGLITESCTIQADTFSIPNLYVHNQGTLTFPLTSSKTLTLVGSAGLQITSDGTLNVGTSSAVVPLSTTHTINLSNTQIDVHNGGNLNVYGYPKLFTTNLVSDYAVGTNTFTVTDPVSSIWKVGDVLTFKPNLTARTGFDTLTIASFTGANTLSTTSNSLFFHTGSATYADIAGVYNLNRNVIIQGLNSTARGTIRTIDAAETFINYAQLSNFGINFSNKNGLIVSNNLNGATTLSGNSFITDSVYNSLTFYGTTKSLYFNGAINSQLTIPDTANTGIFSLGTGNWTIEFWVNRTANTGSIGIFSSCCVTAGAWTSYVNGFQIAYDATPTYLCLLYNSNGAGVFSTINLVALTQLPLNTWNHVAVVRNATSLKCFVNGIQVSDNTLNAGQDFKSDGLAGIGRNDVRTNYNFSGYISNLRVIKGTALYTSNFFPSIIELSNITNTVLLLNSTNTYVSTGSAINYGSTVLYIKYSPFPFNNNIIFNNNILYKSISSGGIFIPNSTNNNININNNYILSSAGIGMQISNSTGSISMSNNTTIGSLSYGTYIANNTLTGTYGANNFNSSAQGMYVAGSNTGTIIGGGLNSVKEGVYVDATTSTLSGVTFQNILANNNSSVGFRVSGNNLNYLTPVVLNINGMTASTNTDAGFEAYNITGNISSIIANNNLSASRISIGNGSTIFDGISSTLSGNCLNILSATNYNQTIIKNVLLSSLSLNSIALNISNVNKFEEFRLEGSTLSASTPFQISSARSKLEGSYIFHNSNSDKYGLSSLALTGYQSDTFTEAGISVINENGLSGSAIRYLASGTISYDASVKHITNNIASEKLEPKSSFIKLRSSSRLIPIKSGSALTISVYIKKSLNYTGASPRLMVVGNSAIGYNDQVLATSSSINDTWEALTGTLPSSTDPGIVEIYVDCSGSTGSGTINIDDWNFS